jgi:hypothetical protein
MIKTAATIKAINFSLHIFKKLLNDRTSQFLSGNFHCLSMKIVKCAGGIFKEGMRSKIFGGCTKIT